MRKSKKEQLKIGNRKIEVSNLGKVLYPGGKFTKGKVIDYYIRISEYLLPHLKNRPVTLKRFPEGVFGDFFYEKDAPAFTPAWVQTVPVPRKETSAPAIRYILINDLPTLIWLANLANLEIHPFLHRLPRMHEPTSMVFDCDPGEGADIFDCVRVAQLLREILKDLDLESFPKVSGSKGIQVYVPLNSRVTYEETAGLAKGLAELLQQREPKLIISEMPKQLRANKVFIDWSQNSEFKTTVSVYSLRAKTHRPYVSLPVEWGELAEALRRMNADQLFFTPEEALDRVENVGDLFKPMLKKVQRLPSDLRKYFEKPTRKKHAVNQTAKTRARKSQRSRQGSRRRFVIHKYAGGDLHYELGLEINNVLKSWSVAKGPPLKKGEMRLAKAIPDRPVEYLNFEDRLPGRTFKRATVMVWDLGTYELIEGDYRAGSVRFYLSGSKLKGEWTLQRVISRKKDTDQTETWHFIKSEKTMRALSKKKDEMSALSGRGIKDIAHDKHGKCK
jgi:bifunctional non-homologous end joining protein LigD